MIQALVEYREGDGTLECLTPNSRRLLERVLGERIDEHTQPYPENEHSFPRLYANDIAADAELNRASKAMAKSLWSFVESVSADRIRMWVENKHTEESLSREAKRQIKAETLRKAKEDSVQRAKARRASAQSAREAKRRRAKGEGSQGTSLAAQGNPASTPYFGSIEQEDIDLA